MSDHATPTQYAAKLFALGYTPEQVLEIMKREKIVFPTISGVLNELLGKKNMSVEVLAGKADMNPATVYKIMSKQFNPSRNALLRIAMSMELTLEETQVLLKSGNCSALSGTRERDLVVMEAIIKKKDYDEVNKTLTKKGLPDLNGRG